MKRDEKCVSQSNHIHGNVERKQKTQEKNKNEKDDGRRKNKEKITSIDFNSTNFYLEVEVFTINAI